MDLLNLGKGNMEEEKVSKDSSHKQIIIDIQEKLEDISNWNIYKVPNNLRKIRPEAYTSQIVSIGPFHHGGRIDPRVQERRWETVEKIQRSYKEETFEPENKKKHRMDPEDILRDACFILELFLRNHENEEEKKKKKQLPDKEIKDCDETQYSGDYILSPWVKAAIKQDLILLENQLPFLVLTRLFDFIFNHPSIDINAIPDDLRELKKNGREVGDFLILITCEFFIDYYKFGKPCTKENSKNKSHPFKWSKEDKEHWVSEMKDIKHFNDLVRKFMYDKKDDFSKSSYDLTHFGIENPSIEGPRQHRVHFQKHHSVGAVCLSNGASYLLDQLINTVEDVEMLVDKRIIENWLGSNRAVADLVNTLFNQIETLRFFYTDICDKLNNYHSKKLNVARATLNRVYFKDIWTGSSTIVGLVFLVFSLFSTYYTIKSLY
nr:uncharacterized protein LOC125423964 [Ziziphus jujuba var. spinosa]